LKPPMLIVQILLHMPDARKTLDGIKTRGMF
jgi:hypothetical protein